MPKSRLSKEYRAVGTACAINLNYTELPCEWERAKEILRGSGYKVLRPDLVGVARELIGKSKYEYGAHISEAPYKTDCSSFPKFVAGVNGIWIERISADQFKYHRLIKDIKKSKPGDLIFTTGEKNWELINSADNDKASNISVGHMGFLTGQKTVIHSQNTSLPYGIVETSMERFLQDLVGITRIIPDNSDLWTIISGPDTDYVFEHSGEIPRFLQSQLKKASAASP